MVNMVKEYCDFCSRRYYERELFFVNATEYACKACLNHIEYMGLLDDEHIENGSTEAPEVNP